MPCLQGTPSEGPDTFGELQLFLAVSVCCRDSTCRREADTCVL